LTFAANVVKRVPSVVDGSYHVPLSGMLTSKFVFALIVSAELTQNSITQQLIYVPLSQLPNCTFRVRASERICRRQFVLTG
jgi:hypothetical protein